jgi:hypothetical protein
MTVMYSEELAIAMRAVVELKDRLAASEKAREYAEHLLAHFRRCADGVTMSNLGHSELAGRVRMVMRNDLMLEPLVEAARDRIIWLADKLHTAESRAESLAAQLESHRKAARLCDEHQPTGGTRSGCLVCGLIRLSAALSRISYACEEPNDQQCSSYDVHCDEDAVVKQVQDRLAALAPPVHQEQPNPELVAALIRDQYSFMTHGKRELPDDHLCRLLRDGFKGYANFTAEELRLAAIDAGIKGKTQ